MLKCREMWLNPKPNPNAITKYYNSNILSTCIWKEGALSYIYDRFNGLLGLIDHFKLKKKIELAKRNAECKLLQSLRVQTDINGRTETIFFLLHILYRDKKGTLRPIQGTWHTLHPDKFITITPLQGTMWLMIYYNHLLYVCRCKIACACTGW